MNKEQKIKIFLVDDDAVFLKTLEIEFLQHGDFIIDTFSTGELCLKNLSEGPDVIILDYHLNGLLKDAMNGIETLDRIKIYNQWLPHVHVDYHEQGYNSPYYFAPAAEPFHEVITNWQREFQVTIGKNNARYFDQNGWLFYTKERYDLFYPSYGDTYPIYNGAIGMTYEQGGGPAGGLGALTDEGDTLTLLDRATHHYTTGLSTIEVSSLNASRLV
jgi:CheY-like chemotaxis protein